MRVDYLTAEEKQAELDRLAMLIPLANHEHNSGLDLDMVPWLKRFNRLPGIVTIQSCEGHIFSHDGYAHVNRGCLVFRYSLFVSRVIRACWEAIPDMPQNAHVSIELREPSESGRREEWFTVWFDGRGQCMSPAPVLAPLLEWLRNAIGPASWQRAEFLHAPVPGLRNDYFTDKPTEIR